MSKTPDIDAWWSQLERLERVLMCVGPDEVCCEGMTPRQTSILRTLIAQEGARLSDLAAASRITPSAMTRNIEKLEKQGMVERVRGRQRRRPCRDGARSLPPAARRAAALISSCASAPAPSPKRFRKTAALTCCGCCMSLITRWNRAGVAVCARPP